MKWMTLFLSSRKCDLALAVLAERAKKYSGPAESLSIRHRDNTNKRGMCAVIETFCHDGLLLNEVRV